MFLPIGYYNKKFSEIGKIQFPPTDLGLQRGFSVFDFFKFRNLNNIWLDWYIDRLIYSCEKISLQLPLDREEIKSTATALVERNNLVDACVKVLVSAGPSSNGYTRSAEPRILMLGLPIPKMDPLLYTDGAHLISEEYKRDLPHVKSTNYLKVATLTEKIRSENAIDVLYHNNGIVAETSRCNIFAIINKNIITPEKEILKGITRKRVLELKESSFKFLERELHFKELKKASEIFITSTTKGVMPVVSIDNFQIGDGTVGPVTKNLISKINIF